MAKAFHRTWIFLAFLAALGQTPSRAAERPNFLFILTDDQAQESIGAYGNTVCQTPNIDRLAREGMLLRDAHHMGSWSGAVCLPSRTMIMTGRTVWHLPNRPLGSPAESSTTDETGRQQRQAALRAAAQQSLPAVFKAAGYDTFRTCKQGNTFGPANEQFALRYEADKREGNAEGGSQWHADHAIDYLRKRAAEQPSAPFLMFLGFSHPHDPRNGIPRLLEKYGAVNAVEPPPRCLPGAPPVPMNYLPEHPFHHGHPGLRDETQVEGVMTDRSPETIRNEIGREYACIENIDIQIGRVLDALEKTGELENTYIIFTSDHGIAVGRHGLMGKQNLYEHTWRVPLLVKGPGIRPSSQASGYVYLLDILPTMCDLAGIAVPDSVEGRSFRPVLEGRAERIRDVLYGAYCGGTKPGIRAVKTDGWKMIKYDVLDGQVRETQMFNLRENPEELLAEHRDPQVVQITGRRPAADQVDLAEDPRYAERRKALEALLADEQQRLDDPYSLWDQPGGTR